MIRETTTKQGQLFSTPFEQELSNDNRWVKFSSIIPWDNLSYFYYSRMNKKMGAGTIDARIVLGALIIKHHENLSDEATILAITENVYMQYF